MNGIMAGETRVNLKDKDAFSQHAVWRNGGSDPA